MSEIPKMYVEDGEDEGRVADPEMAQEMADLEKPYHEKTLGVFPPSERKIKAGEEVAEEHANRHNERGTDLNIDELPDNVMETCNEFIDHFLNTGQISEANIFKARGIHRAKGQDRYKISIELVNKGGERAKTFGNYSFIEATIDLQDGKVAGIHWKDKHDDNTINIPQEEVL